MSQKINGDPYIDFQPATNYYLKEWIGKGKIGNVYKAVRENPYHVLACKIIRVDKLKTGWERELEKVVKLADVPSVVQYHSHNTGLDKQNKPFVWVLWNYIDGINLRKYLENYPWPLDIAFIENIAKTILEVLHACRFENIQHGDLHEGNILISNPDSRIPGKPRRVWISDFGYGGSHNDLSPKDDYRQLFAIITSLLRKLNTDSLNPRDKVLHHKMLEFLHKKVLESDPLQGNYVGNPENLLGDFKMLGIEAERESASATKGGDGKDPGDYLWAEALGYRVEEWRNLFVPEFPAAQDLLSKNITVLTGARGCGKTMSFRRLTAFMDKVIGEPSRVKGSDQFIGFYLNCRDLVEAFPWLPPKLSIGMQQQIIHYFHLCWFSEVTKTLALYDTDNSESYEWFNKFLADIYGTVYQSLPDGANILAHGRAFIENEKERCRVSDLGKRSGFESWPLARVDFLDLLQTAIEAHVPWTLEKPLYLFLDDYTVPIVTRAVQYILNPIIFKRRSKLFFKVSTESSNSFEKKGIRGKPLELHQDFELIDLATENIHLDKKDKEILLDKIFRPRIDRHPAFLGKFVGLLDILGKMSITNNDLAKQMRDNPHKTFYYYGVNAFVGTWTSDIRIMIQIFTDMLRDSNGRLKKGATIIEKAIQDKCYKAIGGEFLIFTESVKDPSFWEKGPSSTKPGERYGTHLKDIVEAFVKVSRYELTKGKLISNQGRLNPKQAFRLEIIDNFDLPVEAFRYYEGLIRWHIFLQDWRGKSVRGMITPRLYLNRVLIPYCNLTFSSHDNIHLVNEDFVYLLKKPKEFYQYWLDKRKKMRNKPVPTSTLFDTLPERDSKS